MSFNINEYYSKVSQGDVLLAYKGSITSELINEVLEAVEEKLEKVNESGKTRKKLYNVLVESLQNLYHHIEETHEGIDEDLDPKFAVLIIERDNEDYKVITGNFIRNTKIGFLKEKIDKINSMTKDELKDMYKFILNHQKISAKGGGGLGLVDIARKTGKDMTYEFYNYNNDYSFFNLTIDV
ncbi:MAG: SiaB family protein kinase [Bacteroidales bacterium]|nr:SiaB family protein kinase [Bacteroidales bacterium]MBN2818335.1 SiaB family protein kinase [Bacteroidales bacterium]